MGVGEGVGVGGAGVSVGGAEVAVTVGAVVFSTPVDSGAGVSVGVSSSAQAITAVSSSNKQNNLITNKPLPIRPDCKQLRQKAKMVWDNS
jgi:hypothetical protein